MKSNKTLTKISAVILSISMFIILFGSIAAADVVLPENKLSETKNYVVTGAYDGLALKAGPGISYSRIDLIPESAALIVQAVKDNWAFTVYNGNEGWVCMDYLHEVSDSLKDYVGCTVHGINPWGDAISVSFEDYANGVLTWELMDFVSDKNLIVNRKFATAIDENTLSGNFSVDKKVYIYDDPNEYFIYRYEGTITLHDETATITFTNGYCTSYLFGGSGADGYSESGAYRMALGQSCTLDYIYSETME